MVLLSSSIFEILLWRSVLMLLTVNGATMDMANLNLRNEYSTGKLLSGTNNSASVTTIVQFEKTLHGIQPPNFKNETVNSSIKILRSGNISLPSTVRVIVSDNGGIDSQSYTPKTALIHFKKNETMKFFDVKIVYDYNLDFKKGTLTVQLVTEDLINAILGPSRKNVVTVVGRNWVQSVLSAPPMVMSLSLDTNLKDPLNNFRSPSYPLICITSCNPLHYEYNKTREFCENSGIGISSVNYFWEIQIPSSASQLQSEFQILTRKTLLSDVDTMILDPAYFSSGYLVRCVVRPIPNNKIMGHMTRSKEIAISSTGYCGTSHNSETVMPFIATLSYVDTDDYLHSNRLKVQVDIPHQDGMIPVISTKKLYNLHLLLNADLKVRKHHLCSNLILPGELESIDPESLFLNPQNSIQQNTKKFYWNFTDNENGTLFYTHLNLERCFWRFVAYFSMSELIHQCEGVVSNSLIEIERKKQTTVRVPLYVASLFASGNMWTSYEYQTEMEISFNYEAMLLPSEFETNIDIDAHLRINRIYLDEDGKLVIDFQTKPKFSGLFVMRHKSNSNICSSLKYLKFSDLHFNLHLRWTGKNNYKPIQSWRASSDYSLNNYSGMYVLELIPCIVVDSLENNKLDILNMCTSHKPKRFEIPIAYQQVNRPTPLIFSLKTYFQLTNNEMGFLSQESDEDFDMKINDIDMAGSFVKGDYVYGRVMWNPGQDLGSAYKLQIEKVYLCADVSSSASDWSSSKSNGCFSSKFMNRILLLDRNVFHEDYKGDDLYRSLRADAKFIDGAAYAVLHRFAGADGFTFKVDGLYDMDLSYRWYVQVTYTIASSTRKRRSIHESDVNYSKLPFHTGSAMRLLSLKTQAQSSSSVISLVLNVTVCLATLTILVFIMKRRYFSGCKPKVDQHVHRPYCLENQEVSTAIACNLLIQSTAACLNGDSYKVTGKRESCLTTDMDTTEHLEQNIENRLLLRLPVDKMLEWHKVEKDMEPKKPIIGAWVVSPTPLSVKSRKSESDVDLVSHSLSLPGFKTFLFPQTYIFRKVIWFCVFTIAISLCAYQISERVRFYLEYPVSTAFAMTSSTTVRFPNVTICLFNPHASTRFYKYFNETPYSMQDVYNILRNPAMTVNDLWTMSMEDREDFILNCTFGKNSCMNPEYWTMEDNACGRCHVLHFIEEVPYLGADTQIKLTLRDLNFSTKVNDSITYVVVKILLHNEYSNRVFGSFIQALSIYPKVWARYRYWVKEFVYENTPVHPCVDNLNFSVCMQMCYEEQLYGGSTKCRLPFSVYAGDYPLCTYDQFYEIYNYSLMSTFADIDASKCDCGRPCHDINYDIKPDLRNSKDPGKSTIVISPGRVDMESMYEVRVYTLTSLVSDIGGALGLYLGACILTFFEMINLMYQAIVRKRRHIIDTTKTVKIRW